jgi:transcriptional regulator with XRE-family HTH domain
MGLVMVIAPPVRRRLVGKSLRWHRQRLGYTVDDAARILECDRSKISRIETGQRGIRRKELVQLLTEYGIDEGQQALLAGLTDPRGAFGWHRDYTDILPGAVMDYLILETAASRIAGYEAQRVPVLLQTPAYARALAQGIPGLADEAAWDRAAEAVLARQDAILGQRRPGQYPDAVPAQVHLVIGQAALSQRVGGVEVMREQLGTLARAATSGGRVTVQVLPSDCGAHAAAGEGSLELLEFTGAEELGIVHLGGIGGGVCLEGRKDIATYKEAYGHLLMRALSPAQSASLLREIARG